MEYTIEITQYCENDCSYCSTNATPLGKHLPMETVLCFLEQIGRNDRINISGGEPLAHPDFYKILRACQGKSDNVWVYTNALNKVKYNAQVLTDGICVEANYCLYPDCFSTACNIPDGIKVNLLKFVQKGRGKGIKEKDFHTSGNMHHDCSGCQHKLLQADGQIAKAPCQKNY